jgi:ribosomal protein L9
MKVILQETVKGKGKEGQIIDVPSGYANFLIREKKAVAASEENIESKQQKDEAARQAELDLIAAMKELALVLQDKPVQIAMKVGSEGRTFGSVSTKQIVSAFQQQHHIDIDKRKIDLTDTIQSLGQFQVPIQLHKDVPAILKVHVVAE